MKASDILGFKDLRTKTIKVPEWSTELTIKELSLEQGLAMFSMVQSLNTDKPTMSGKDIAQVIAWSVIDENGERVFSDEDVPQLAQKSRKALMSIYLEITSLNGEDAEKN